MNNIKKENTSEKRGRGRPKKATMSLEEQEDEVILKYLNGEPMTLEEAALALWMSDGRPACGPMSKMGMLKMENRILEKLRKKLIQAGLSPEVFSELFDAKRDKTTNRNYKILTD